MGMMTRTEWLRRKWDKYETKVMALPTDQRLPADMLKEEAALRAVEQTLAVDLHPVLTCYRQGQISASELVHYVQHIDDDNTFPEDEEN